jgi:hypothetical protein
MFGRYNYTIKLNIELNYNYNVSIIMNVRSILQKRELNEIAEIPLHEVANVQVFPSCASMHRNSDWPMVLSLEAHHNLVYNCLQYVLSDGSHVVVSADVKGIYADGDSMKDAVKDFRPAVQTRISEGLGGLYLGTSDYVFQENEFRDLENEWKSDGVKIIKRHRAAISVFICN